jgi:hypothetical protein
VQDLRELDAYAYSGHSVLMGKNKREWQDREYVLRYFGESKREAKRGYASYVSEGVEQGRRPELVGGGLLRSVGGWKGLHEIRNSGERVRGDERILGGSEFVERVLRESEEEWERRSLLRKRGLDLKWLVEKVARHFGVKAEFLKSGSKVPAIAKARAVLCYLGVHKIGLSSASIAKELGISPSAVSRGISRASEVLKGDDIEGQFLECQ